MLTELRRATAAILLAAGFVVCADLSPTPLQAEIAQAFQVQAAFRHIAPTLSNAIEGRTADESRAQQEFMSLPSNQPAILAMGNSAMGLIQERSKPGSGKVWLRESARLADRDLGLHWNMLLLQMHFGTASSFATQLDGMESAMLALGWQRLPEAASWLLASAQDLRRSGRDETAVLALQAAIRLDPVSPVPSWSAALLDIRTMRFSEAYSAFRESIRRIVTYPSAQQVFAFNLLRFARYTLALTFLLVLIAWLIRYWPWIAHEWAERLPRDTPILLRYLVLASVLLALLIAGLGLLSLSFLAAFLLWKPAKRHERVILSLLILFTGAQPWIAGLEGSLSRRFDRSGTEAIYQRTVEEGYSPELEATLDQASSIASSDQSPLLTAGHAILLRKKDIYLDALAEARRAAELGSSDPRVLITLGNMHFLVGHFDTALALYKKAELLDPGNPVLTFNLGQAYSYRSRLDSTAMIFGAASTVAQYRVEVQAHQNSRHFQTLPANRLVLDAELSSELSWTSLFDEFLSGKTSIGRWDLHTGVLDLPPLLLPWVAAILLGWLLVRGSAPPRRRVLFTCKTCGRVMCGHCRKGLHCAQCFRKLSGVDEIELRNELLERIEKDRIGQSRLLRLGLDLAVPGMGRLVSAPGIMALIQLTIFSAALGYALNLPNFLSLYPTSETLAGRPLALAVLAILYIVAGIQLVRGISRSTFAPEGK